MKLLVYNRPFYSDPSLLRPALPPPFVPGLDPVSERLLAVPATSHESAQGPIREDSIVRIAHSLSSSLLLLPGALECSFASCGFLDQAMEVSSRRASEGFRRFPAKPKSCSHDWHRVRHIPSAAAERRCRTHSSFPQPPLVPLTEGRDAASFRIARFDSACCPGSRVLLRLTELPSSSRTPRTSLFGGPPALVPPASTSATAMAVAWVVAAE